jgi:dolichyl-phosphate beta-glucosyltransferase
LQKNNSSEKKSQLSIIIPCYNEDHRIGKTIEAIIAWAQTSNLDYELIIADDGSSDQTRTRAEAFQDRVPHLRILTLPHQGKGAAVRSGMLAARGQEVLFMDADGSAPLSEIEGLRQALKEGAPIAIGSRVIPKGAPKVIRTYLHRKIMGRCFAFLVNRLVLKGIKDTQCGLKLFKQEVAQDLFSRQELDGFAFDVEILYLAHRKGYSIKEIPVNWINQEGSKVGLIRDSGKMFWDILRIPFLHRRDSFI